jgi:uncharacterized protein YdaU (DUF1376 family)
MKRPWMPFYVSDYLVDTIDLTTEQHGVYILLLMKAWCRPDGRIPGDEKWIKAVLPPMHGHTFNRLVRPILERFFQRDADGYWSNKRLTNEMQKLGKFSEKQKQNANKRWQGSNEIN